MARKNRGKKQSRSQLLKLNAKVRSEQARKNEAMRDYSTGTLPSLTTSSLMHATPNQLEQIASRVGRIYAAEQDMLRERESEPFQIAPTLHITKKDRMYAARPTITLQQINDAPKWQRKLLRQQRKRRNEAKEKIGRAREYQRMDAAGYTIGQIRDLSERGESPIDIVGGMSAHATPREHFLRTRKNVLGNGSFVRASMREDRRTLIKAIQLYGKMSGLKVPEGLGRDIGRFKDETDAMTSTVKWADKMSSRLGAFGSDIQRRFDSLSNRQKKWLIDKTFFGGAVEQGTYYDSNSNQFQVVGKGVNARQRVEDFLSQAERM